MPDPSFERELERAAEFYETRDSGTAARDTWSPLHTDASYIAWQQRTAFLRLLRRAGITSLEALTIADFGCGEGGWLLWLASLGLDQRNAFGVDLSQTRVEAARAKLPLARFDAGSAHSVDLPDASRDMVSQNTLFSSVHDAQLRAAIAAEMDRVLKPGGVVLWCDIRPAGLPYRAYLALMRFAWALLKGMWTQGPSAFRKPAMADYLVPFSEAEVSALFPGYRAMGEPVCLPMSLVRVRGRGSALLAAVLDLVPGFRTNLAMLLVKPAFTEEA